MKFLCVCQDGNVRSVAMAYQLHNKHGHEAVPVGWKRLSKASLDLFCEWADRIVIMQAEYADKIGDAFKSKILIAEVGRDRYGCKWGRGLPELVAGITAQWKADGTI